MARSAFLEDIARQRPSLTSEDYLQERLESSLAGKDDLSFVELLVDGTLESLRNHGSDSTYGSFTDSTTSPTRFLVSVKCTNEPVLPLLVVRDQDELRRRMKAGSFQLIVIRQRNSISSLSISHELLTCLMETCHVSTRLLDFIICFGPKNGETRLTPPMTWAAQATATGAADRVSEDFECAYILRFPEQHYRSESKPWSLRQFLLYHRSSQDPTVATIIFAGVGKAVVRSLQKYILCYRDRQALNAWEIHLVLLNAVVTTWRPYLAYLGDEVNTQADHAVLADLEGEDADFARLDERQYLKQLEDGVDEAASILAHTRKAAEILRANFGLCKGFTAESEASEDDVVLLDQGFQEVIHNLRHHEAQTQILHTKVKSASDLVSNILDLSNSTALKNLALESARENAVMHELTKKATQDAAAVKVLTVLTLIYLPATVISNFFSTSFVNASTRQDGSTFLVVASNWWILLATALPLTIITIYIWRFYVQKEIHGEYPAWWQSVQRKYASLRMPAFRHRHPRNELLDD
ncbi:hypothetical protein HRR95_008550 [Exophiala dermatitidis]|nr:hypothetical protein HRR95_008550 [Exophiala dermatitidis]